MTPKQILDSFSETLMRDERILSERERALLGTLLQHAKVASCENADTQQAVRSVIASAVGETVAQRAFAVLGANIVERIIEGGATTVGSREELLEPQAPGRPMRTPEPQAPGRPVKPHEPQSPGVKPPRPMRDTPVPPPEPQSPGKPVRTPDVPAAPEPQSPGHGYERKVVSGHATAVAERPQTLPANCVVLDEFLAPQELTELMRFAIEHESEFEASEVVSPTSENGIVNHDHRRSRVLMQLGQYEKVILDRIKAVLPSVLDKLGMQKFDITDVEAQITASNDGDFFHFHSDNGSERVATRQLTFVYFFHREPRAFAGGELRIHDARLEGGAYVSQGSFQTIVPRQNQIVFFPCELLHEITPVNCSSEDFADSRFTLNGWLRR